MLEFIKTLWGAKEQMAVVTVILGVLVVISGSVGFTMFIFEEATQVTTFAAFSYQQSKDWDGLEQHLLVMKSVDRTARFFIKYFGILCPLMYPAYLEYMKGNAAYIRTTERRIEKEREAEKKGRWKHR